MHLLADSTIGDSGLLWLLLVVLVVVVIYKVAKS